MGFADIINRGSWTPAGGFGGGLSQLANRANRGGGGGGSVWSGGLADLANRRSGGGGGLFGGGLSSWAGKTDTGRALLEKTPKRRPNTPDGGVKQDPREVYPYGAGATSGFGQMLAKMMKNRQTTPGGLFGGGLASYFNR